MKPNAPKPKSKSAAGAGAMLAPVISAAIALATALLAAKGH